MDVILNDKPTTYSRARVPIAPNGEIKKVEHISKRKQSKSRNGCTTCKAKRMKCDEIKPCCQQCSRRNIPCGGYLKDIRWKHIGNPKKSSSSQMDMTQTLDEFSTGCSQPTDLAMSDAEIWLVEDEGDKVMRHLSTQSFLPRAESGFESTSEGVSPSIAPFEFIESPMEFIKAAESSLIHTDGGMFDDRNAEIFDSLHSAISSTANQSHNLDDLDAFLMGADGGETFCDHQSPDSLALHLPDHDMATELQTSLGWSHYTPDATGSSQVAVQEKSSGKVPWQIPKLHSSIETWVTSIGLQSLHPALPSGQELYPFYEKPLFSSGSPEMISLLFDHETCRILSIKEESSMNPWRTLIWPLAKDHPSLYHAIAAMTCLHMCRAHPQLRNQGVEHFRRSTEALAVSRDSGNICLDAALAARIALGFAETWDHRKSSTGIDHIKDAKVLLQRALSEHQMSNRPAGELSRLSFLANTWTYMDVIARFTSVSNGTSIDFDFITSCSLLSPVPQEHQIDPLMGCAITLFPTIGRVADIVSRVRRRTTERNSPAIISKAIELKCTLERWVPPVDLEGLDPRSNIVDSIQTAEAYRWATLLLLRQAIPELPCLTTSWELSQKVLVFLATIPLTSRATIVQIFPLMAAGCEALDGEDRDWVRERWDLMSQRMITGIVDRCKTVTEEVWKRRDKYEAPCELSHAIGAGKPSFSILSRECLHMDVLTVHDVPGNVLGGSEPFTSSDDSGCRCSTRKSARSSASDFPISAAFKNSGDGVMCGRNKDYAVRGKLHWLGVMEDWDWEVMLG